jgi:hypothetical protein
MYLQCTDISYKKLITGSTEDAFRHGISRTKQRVGKKIYHEVTFRAANGEQEHRYFDITDIVHD